jgi:solute carrier family 25 carnitine/acylcarnitine transporter 20/29
MAEKKPLLSLNDFISGSCAGVVQVLLGQPLDIIKVRMQTQNQSSLIQCAKDIYTKEGPAAFYKGTLSPLIGISFCVAIQFGANELAKRYLMNQKIANGQPTQLAITDYIKCGMFAGFCNAFVISPVELVRIKMQVQGNSEVKQFKSTIDCFQQIVSKYGIRGIFQGLGATIFRETPAFAIYFGVYETLMARDAQKYGGRRDQIPKVSLCINGGLAGLFLWIGTFPHDVIKSRIQADNLDNRKYKTILDTIRIVYREKGVGGFFKGLTPCLIRAPPINAATFLTFEMVSSHLRKNH